MAGRPEELGGAPLHRLVDVEAEYRRAFERTTGLVFASPEWLEAVGDDRVAVLDLGAEVGAPTFVPVEVSRRAGLVRVSNPPLTPWLYPVGGHPGGSNPARVADANRTGAAIAHRLPGTAYAKLRLHPSFPSFLGLHWDGFLALARISYRVDAGSSDAAWRAMRGELRTDVRRAQRNGVDVRWDTAVDDIASLLESHATAAGFTHPMAAGPLATFLRRVIERGIGQVGSAWHEGALCAAVVLAVDPACAHYLLAGSNEGGRRSKAVALLAWSALADALDAGRSFDFTGSMLQGVEHFNRSFGGRQVIDPLMVRPPLGKPALRAARQATRLALSSGRPRLTGRRRPGSR